MLVIDFDPSRKRESGQYHVRLIDARSGDFGNDARRQNQLGYWCDLGHLESGILAPVAAAVKQAASPHEAMVERMRKALKEKVAGWIPSELEKAAHICASVVAPDETSELRNGWLS